MCNSETAIEAGICSLRAPHEFQKLGSTIIYIYIIVNIAQNLRKRKARKCGEPPPEIYLLGAVSVLDPANLRDLRHVSDPRFSPNSVGEF